MKELDKKIMENYQKIKELSGDSHKAFVTALLIFENASSEYDYLTEPLLEIYKNAYEDYMANDDYKLINDEFEWTVAENTELYFTEQEENKQRSQKDVKNKELER